MVNYNKITQNYLIFNSIFLYSVVEADKENAVLCYGNTEAIGQQHHQQMRAVDGDDNGKNPIVPISQRYLSQHINKHSPHNRQAGRPKQKQSNRLATTQANKIPKQTPTSFQTSAKDVRSQDASTTANQLTNTEDIMQYSEYCIFATELDSGNDGMVNTSMPVSKQLDAKMEESWFITPPPCFTSIGPINMETSPFENLLIEHPR